MLRRVLVSCALCAIAAGCGGGERPLSLREHQAAVARDPYALTCDDLARQPDTSTNQRVVINAEFALAEAPMLRQRVEAMTANRVGRSVYWALTELCKGRDPEFRPARAAVEAVRDGKYLVQPRPESWSQPELWSDPAVEQVAGD